MLILVEIMCPVLWDGEEDEEVNKGGSLKKRVI
jgi:hypothetical protein